MSTYIAAVIDGYLSAMDWTECGPDAEDAIREGSFSPELSAAAHEDVTDFLDAVAGVLQPLDLNPSQIGCDFWLTRNGHGTGFWDRPEIYGELTAEALSDTARSFGEISVYAGDDGLLYTC
jgi:hypothetical protein